MDENNQLNIMKVQVHYETSHASSLTLCSSSSTLSALTGDGGLRRMGLTADAKAQLTPQAKDVMRARIHELQAQRESLAKALSGPPQHGRSMRVL